MIISNDTGQTRSAGDAFAKASFELRAAAAADIGDGAGGDAAPATDGALGSLARDWQAGLYTYGRQVEAHGRIADLVAEGFDALDGMVP